MTEAVIAEGAMKELRRIHQLSKCYNARVFKDHNERLLELMEKHAQEIRELFSQGREHFLVETGDLLVLCFELLLENGASIDAVLQQCFGRYNRKLNSLMEDIDGKKRKK